MNQVTDVNYMTQNSQVIQDSAAQEVAVPAIRLQDHVQAHLTHYFSQLDGTPPTDIYNMVLREVEKPMLEVVLQYMRYNQSKTAVILGLSRGTLRKKMKEYGLLDAPI